MTSAWICIPNLRTDRPRFHSSYHVYIIGTKKTHITKIDESGCTTYQYIIELSWDKLDSGVDRSMIPNPIIIIMTLLDIESLHLTVTSGVLIVLPP